MFRGRKSIIGQTIRETEWLGHFARLLESNSVSVDEDIRITGDQIILSHGKIKEKEETIRMEFEFQYGRGSESNEKIEGGQGNGQGMNDGRFLRKNA